MEEKQSLYGELKGEWDIHCADDLVICLGDFNGMVVGILMVLMEDMVKVRGIWKEEC